MAEQNQPVLRRNKVTPVGVLVRRCRAGRIDSHDGGDACSPPAVADGEARHGDE